MTTTKNFDSSPGRDGLRARERARERGPEVNLVLHRNRVS